MHISLKIKGCGSYAELLADLEKVTAAMKADTADNEKQLDESGECDWEFDNVTVKLETQDFVCNYCGESIS